MKKRVFLLSIIAVTMFVISGCSDSATDITQGDPEDEGYQVSKADVDTTMTEINEDLLEAVDSLMVGGLAKLTKPVDYDTIDGWHVRSRTLQNDNWDKSVVDSFRFTDAEGEYQNHRDLTTHQFERRLKRNISYDSGLDGGQVWDKERNRNMNWIGLTDTITTLNGDVYRHYYGQNYLRTFEHTTTGVIENVVFETDDIFDGRPTHPISGQLTGSIVTDKQLPNRDVHFEAEFTVTFYPDHYHVHLVSGNSYWDWDYYYE